MRRHAAATLFLLVSGCGLDAQVFPMPGGPPVTPSRPWFSAPGGGGPGSINARPGMTLRMLTYNTWGKPGLLGTDEKQRFKRLPGVLTPFDLVLLQETFTKHSEGLLGTFPFVQRETGRGLKIMHSGLTVLSRFEIKESDFQKFTDCTQWDCLANKGVSFVRLNVPNVGPLDVYNTHYQAEEGDAPRRVRLGNNQVLERLFRAHDRGYPAVIAGDFNATPDSPEYADLKTRLPVRDLFRDLNPNDPGYTLDPSRNPNLKPSEGQSRIDYVFAIGGRIRPLRAEVVMDQPVDGYTLSDHLGVAVDLDILAN